MISCIKKYQQQVVEESKKAVYENAHKAKCQDEWEEQHDGYVARHEKTIVRVSALEEMKDATQSRCHMLNDFIRDIEGCSKVIDEFDERLWTLTIEKVMVRQDVGIVFALRMGRKLRG